ncbi:secretion protein [Alcanivorax nanhaiticus]|uniref:Secretion protein n=1 Tax=Alcanivorax nanhaiticus TaxID=1177154 RepID=A0A095SH80_9GAMM|nr:type IV pilin protein [Alcanivorax nanhaiticus]KGD63699.1 secretion protein [Alcanivorax nanhaiticus]
MMNMRKSKAFTLIELLIVIAIISVLAAISFPSYVAYMERTHRLDTQSSMLDLASSLEIYRSQNLSYQGAKVSDLAPSLANNQFYTIVLSPDPLPAGSQDYEITATPKSTERMKGTGAMKLNSNGESCWDETSDTSCTYGTHSWN